MLREIPAGFFKREEQNFGYALQSIGVSLVIRWLFASFGTFAPNFHGLYQATRAIQKPEEVLRQHHSSYAQHGIPCNSSMIHLKTQCFMFSALLSHRRIFILLMHDRSFESETCRLTVTCSLRSADYGKVQNVEEHGSWAYVSLLPGPRYSRCQSWILEGRSCSERHAKGPPARQLCGRHGADGGPHLPVHGQEPWSSGDLSMKSRPSVRVLFVLGTLVQKLCRCMRFGMAVAVHEAREMSRSRVLTKAQNPNKP